MTRERKTGIKTMKHLELGCLIDQMLHVSIESPDSRVEMVLLLTFWLTIFKLSTSSSFRELSSDGAGVRSPHATQGWAQRHLVRFSLETVNLHACCVTDDHPFSGDG